jgi:hypothetical protein
MKNLSTVITKYYIGKTNIIILRVIAQSTNPTEVCDLCPSSSSNIGSSPLLGAYFKKCSSIYLINTSVFDQPVFDTVHRIFNNECHKEMKNLSTVITKYYIFDTACRAYSKALSAENLRHAI